MENVGNIAKQCLQSDIFSVNSARLRLFSDLIQGLSDVLINVETIHLGAQNFGFAFQVLFNRGQH